MGSACEARSAHRIRDGLSGDVFGIGRRLMVAVLACALLPDFGSDNLTGSLVDVDLRDKSEMTVRQFEPNYPNTALLRA